MIKRPFVVLPRVYWLPLNFWRWCKLGEVCKVVRNVARIGGYSFRPTPEELVQAFATLIRPNTPRMLRTTGSANKEIGKKLFRYSVTGRELRAKEVPPWSNDVNIDPPYAPFTLEDCSPDIFVPEGWARDVILAVQQGAKAVIEFVPGNLRGIAHGRWAPVIDLKLGGLR